MSLRNIMMGAEPKPVTFIASASTQNTVNGNTLVVNKPAGTQQGDLMIAFMCEEGANFTFTGDTGWTEIADQGVRPNLRIAYKIAGASEGSSYAFTSSANNHLISGSILTYRNAAFDVIGSIAENARPLVVSGINVSINASVLLAFLVRDQPSYTIPTPSGMSVVVTDNDSSACSYRIFSQSVNAGATGSRSSDLGTDVQVSGVLMSIKPI